MLVKEATGNPVTLTFDLISWEVLLLRKSLFSLCVYKYDYDNCTHSQAIGTRTCSQSHALLNVNIGNNIQSHAVMSRMMSPRLKWFHFK